MRSAAIERFPGLDLRQDPGDTPGAIDALNVTFEQGRVRARYGSTLLGTHTFAPLFLGRARRPDGLDHLVAYGGTSLAAYTAAGALVSSVASTTLGVVGTTGVNIGTPSATYFYVGTPATAGVVRRWDGAAWTAPAAFGALPFSPGYPVLVVGSTTTDSRMIACQASTIRFSDPGAPETYGTNNYVNLGPGDGEDILGVANYANQTFVFKRSKFYVFYGQSTDGEGNPVFNKREVDTGIGIGVPSLGAACTGPDGVYFVGRDGIYRTAGGAPVRISQPLDPLFAGQALPFYTGGSWTGASERIRMAWVDDTLYIANHGVMLAYDRTLDAWTVWNGPGAGLLLATVAFPQAAGAFEEDTLLVGKEDGGILRLAMAATTDNAVAITSRYRSGFMDFGSAGQKKIAHTLVDGTGSPTLKWSKDWGALNTGATVALGATPSTKRQRVSVRGRTFSFQVGGTGAWSVAKVQPNLMDSIRPVSVL